MKKIVGLLVVFFIASASQVFATDCQVGKEVKNGTIVIGYAFYCKNDSDSQKSLSKDNFEKIFGKHKVGLMAAPSDQEKGMRWSNGKQIETSATRREVGSGLWNTIKIISVQGVEAYAAMSCYNKDTSLDSRWFLPSIDEFGLMDSKLASQHKGNFQGASFWSSTEYSSDMPYNALRYSFIDSSMFNDFRMASSGNKHLFESVHCARAF